jgi:hypothetical protein
MELTTDMGAAAIVSLAVISIALGVVLHLIGDVEFGYEWVVTAIAAFAGGFIASEWITSFRTVEPVWDGMAVVPALAGALIVGIAVDAIVRFTTHGSYGHHVPA